MESESGYTQLRKKHFPLSDFGNRRIESCEGALTPTDRERKALPLSHMTPLRTEFPTRLPRMAAILTELQEQAINKKKAGLVLADMSLSQPVEDRFLIFDYRDCDHPMRLDDRDLSQHSQATFPSFKIGYGAGSLKRESRPIYYIRSLIESGIGAFSYSSKSATGTTGTSFMVISFHLLPRTPLWQTASTEAKGTIARG